MKPGTTMAAPLASTRVEGPTRRAMAALSPTAATVSPTTATPPAQGVAESPVQTRPKTTRSAGAASGRPAAQAPSPSRSSAPGRTRVKAWRIESVSVG